MLSIGKKFLEKNQLDILYICLINVKWFWDNLIFPIYSLNGVLNSWAIKSRVDKIGFLRKNAILDGCSTVVLQVGWNILDGLGEV